MSPSTRACRVSQPCILPYMPRYGDGRGVAPEEQASRVIALGPGFPSPPTRSHSAGVRTLFISDAEAKDVRDAAIRDFLGGTDAA